MSTICPTCGVGVDPACSTCPSCGAAVGAASSSGGVGLQGPPVSTAATGSNEPGANGTGPKEPGANATGPYVAGYQPPTQWFGLHPGGWGTWWSPPPIQPKPRRARRFRWREALILSCTVALTAACLLILLYAAKPDGSWTPGDGDGTPTPVATPTAGGSIKNGIDLEGLLCSPAGTTAADVSGP